MGDPSPFVYLFPKARTWCARTAESIALQFRN
jgi:hypothetical protein